ncbi:hypothetical protein DICPUDRAFT_147260 [Dictyostelium purpureum]|uniref:Uncharacterized protein n=1 Tax=Dictyostelium purpureum TaxID=5786 RepID=F0Z823_DICPU|nr:uncharacterized protein DICPUDRAFT_147260 [Dictyostelium purpureum]EGC39945.1 hypothetical protein DICPUDRAFT_147260 [Dictyostelium purpureum]|eukprot:XP_003283574.1 hypothetical protein DICPUDRAFT_147260 [Dictyostelium purpureum]
MTKIEQIFQTLAYQYMEGIPTIDILNGEKKTKRELYLKSIELNKDNSPSNNNLANTMHPS